MQNCFDGRHSNIGQKDSKFDDTKVRPDGERTELAGSLYVAMINSESEALQYVQMNWFLMLGCETAGFNATDESLVQFGST